MKTVESKRIFSKVAVLFSISSILFCSQKEIDERMVFYGLNGSVKSCYEKAYYAKFKFGQWDKGDISYVLPYKVTFDLNTGHYTQKEVYSETGELLLKTIPKREQNKIVEENTYGENGELKEKVRYSEFSPYKYSFVRYDIKGDTIFFATKYLNKNNRLIKQEFTSANKSDIWEYEYNSDGFLSKIVTKDTSGQIIFFRRYKYIEIDDKGNWIKRIEYTSENSDEPEIFTDRVIEYAN